MKETVTCSNCHESYPGEQLIQFNGNLYCSHCLENETFTCARCGTRVFNSENAGNDNLPLCSCCYDDYFTTCDHCGEVILTGDAYYEDCDDETPYCYACFQQLNNDDCPIRDYYYKPSPIFYGQGNRYFGIELEVDGAGECDGYAEQVISIANLNAEHIYCKHDGSLSDGFEVVTHPMTLEYHLNKMPWSEILSKLLSIGFLSHKTDTCGLHIHVNRNAFGDTVEAQEACIARILYFFEKHWDELLKFSRRTEYQLSRWAARYGYKEHPMDILDHAKKGANSGRYSSVNLYNHSTIEFRIFRGTLKLNTLIATLQLVNRVCDVAFSLSDDEIKALSWTSFVADCTEPELIQYLKEQRLYVNEPLSSEEDM